MTQITVPPITAYLVAPIHPKAMPVILDDEREERWLAGDLDGLVEPFPSQLMTVAQA